MKIFIMQEMRLIVGLDFYQDNIKVSNVKAFEIIVDNIRVSISYISANNGLRHA